MIQQSLASKIWQSKLLKKCELVLGVPWHHRQMSCALVFIITFTLKIAHFNETLFQLQQDEDSFYFDFLSKSFGSYLMVPDAGYPIPGLRFVSWILFSIVPSPGLFHITVTLIASTCVILPLVMCDSQSEYSYFFFSVLALGVFWSSDLLYCHNLPYYFALPVLMKIHKDPDLTDTSTKIVLFLAIAFASKPQILLLLLYVSAYSIFKIYQKLNRFGISEVVTSVLCLTYFLMLALGRVGSSSLDLNLEPTDFIKRLTLMPFSAASHLIPVVTLGLAGANYTNLMSSHIWSIVSSSVFLVVSVCFLWFLRYSRLKIYICGLVIGSIVPLLVFPNSGWSVYTPSEFLYFPLIHQRHDLFVLAVLVLVVIPTFTSRGGVYKLTAVRTLPVCLLLQEFFLIVAYQYFPLAN
jgi:hypothetical protein